MFLQMVIVTLNKLLSFSNFLVTDPFLDFNLNSFSHSLLYQQIKTEKDFFHLLKATVKGLITQAVSLTSEMQHLFGQFKNLANN